MTDATAHPDNLQIASSRREVIARWKRRAVRVAIARKALPIAILGILAAMGSWIGMETLRPHIGSLSISATDIRMANPRFYGRDSKDRAFLLSADEAIRSDSDPDVTNLTKPVFTLESSRVWGDRGVYREGTDRIVLTHNVVFIDGQGKRLDTQQAFINTKTGILTNGDQSQGIEIASPMGHVHSKTYTADRNGNVTLRGEVNGTLNLKQKK
jgi:lipopolysaccharide export system protein LptC